MPSPSRRRSKRAATSRICADAARAPTRARSSATVCTESTTTTAALGLPRALERPRDRSSASTSTPRAATPSRRRAERDLRGGLLPRHVERPHARAPRAPRSACMSSVDLPIPDRPRPARRRPRRRRRRARDRARRCRSASGAPRPARTSASAAAAPDELGGAASALAFADRTSPRRASPTRRTPGTAPASAVELAALAAHRRSASWRSPCAAYRARAGARCGSSTGRRGWPQRLRVPRQPRVGSPWSRCALQVAEALEREEDAVLRRRVEAVEQVGPVLAAVVERASISTPRSAALPHVWIGSAARLQTTSARAPRSCPKRCG